ncbi:MAG: hypothetical protein HQK49_05135 [Oligoflexia bacterium]|nr:hypothetical protein [Oligoflexia bacterium]
MEMIRKENIGKKRVMVLSHLNQLKSEFEMRLHSICLNVAKGIGLDIYDLEYKTTRPPLLRIYIFDTNSDTATIEDCVRFDEALTPFIESEEWIPKGITLEVSSPGIYRTIKTLYHFQRALNKVISVTTNVRLDQQYAPELPKRFRGGFKVKGKLLEVKEDENMISMQLDDKNISIKFDDIKRANVDLD